MGYEITTCHVITDVSFLQSFVNFHNSFSPTTLTLSYVIHMIIWTFLLFFVNSNSFVVNNYECLKFNFMSLVGNIHLLWLGQLWSLLFLITPIQLKSLTSFSFYVLFKINLIGTYFINKQKSNILIILYIVW